MIAQRTSLTGLLLLLATFCFGCFLDGNDDDDDAFCRNRNNQVVEDVSEAQCNEAGSDIAEWIDDLGCYCF